MNYKMIGRILAQILALEAALMTPALALAIYDRNQRVVFSFFATIGIILVIASIMWVYCKNAKRIFYAREGYVCAGGCWIVMSILGCLPFYFSGEIPKYIDALFEIVSGFTTTGATIMPDVEIMSRGSMLWRCFSHWIGGMGVLVLLLAVMSGGGQNNGFTLHILRAESPGPNVGKLVPKMRQTAIILYALYFVLTILCFFFLIAGDMHWFDALCTAFGTAGTGGFGVKNDSLASYSPYIQNVCTIFMLLFGVNFSCYYLLLIKQFKSVFKDEELRLYILTVVVSITLITINLGNYYETLAETIRHSAFQVASIMTTTGFATTDFDLWPNFSKSILMCLMLSGACAGSTGGGFKFIRIILLFKSLKRGLQKALNPKKVQVVTINKSTISENVITGTQIYLTIYVIIMITSFLVISTDGFSMLTNMSAVNACFNNIGPGFDSVGPVCNYAGYSTLSKIVLIFDMLAGRLEILPIIFLLSISTWKRKNVA